MKLGDIPILTSEHLPPCPKCDSDQVFIGASKSLVEFPAQPVWGGCLDCGNIWGPIPNPDKDMEEIKEAARKFDRWTRRGGLKGDP